MLIPIGLGKPSSLHQSFSVVAVYSNLYRVAHPGPAIKRPRQPFPPNQDRNNATYRLCSIGARHAAFYFQHSLEISPMAVRPLGPGRLART